MSIKFAEASSYVTDTNLALASVTQANGFAVGFWLYVTAGTPPTATRMVLSPVSDNRIRVRRLANTDTWEVAVTTDNGASMTTIGSAFTIPTGEWVHLAVAVRDGEQKVYLWTAGAGSVAVVDDAEAFIGTPSDTTGWRLGATEATTAHPHQLEDFAVWTPAPSNAALQSLQTDKARATTAIPTGLVWNVRLDQTTGTVTDGDAGLEDQTASNFDFTVAGSGAAPVWDAASPNLDAPSLATITTATVTAGGVAIGLEWADGGGGGYTEPVVDVTDWTKKAFIQVGGSDGYGRLFLDPDGPSSDYTLDVGGSIVATYSLRGRVYDGEAFTITMDETLWTDSSSPAISNAGVSAVSGPCVNDSALTAGAELTRFDAAPIAVSVTPHKRPITTDTAPVYIFVCDEWHGVKAVRFNWFESDGATPLELTFTPSGGAATAATAHTMAASAWVQPFAHLGSTEYAELWGGTLSGLSALDDGTEIKWTFEVQGHDDVWRSTCSDGTAWPMKSLLKHANPAVYHLAGGGNDTTGDGSAETPFATLAAAALVTAVRAATGPVEIRHAAGSYAAVAIDYRPGGTGTAHEHLITIRPEEGLSLGDVVYTNTGLSADANRRGNFEYRDIEFDMAPTDYSWKTTTANVEATERACCVHCIDARDATKVSGAGSLGFDGDDVYIISLVRTGHYRGPAINEFDPGAGYRAVKDVILFDIELSDSGTALQYCLNGGFVARWYVHGCAQDSDYPPSTHFDCFHGFQVNDSVNHRVVFAYNRVLGNGNEGLDYAYNFNLTTTDHTDFCLCFNVRNDFFSQPAIQMQTITRNFQCVFNTEPGTLNLVREEAAGDDEVGRRVLVQNNLLGSIASYRNKLQGMPERVLGGNLTLDDTGYNADAVTDGSVAVADGTPADWGLEDFDTVDPEAGDYRPASGGAALATVPTRPTNFRYDIAGSTMNRAAPGAAGAYQLAPVLPAGDRIGNRERMSRGRH